MKLDWGVRGTMEPIVAYNAVRPRGVQQWPVLPLYGPHGPSSEYDYNFEARVDDGSLGPKLAVLRRIIEEQTARERDMRQNEDTPVGPITPELLRTLLDRQPLGRDLGWYPHSSVNVVRRDSTWEAIDRPTASFMLELTTSLPYLDQDIAVRERRIRVIYRAFIEVNSSHVLLMVPRDEAKFDPSAVYDFSLRLSFEDEMERLYFPRGRSDVSSEENIQFLRTKAIDTFPHLFTHETPVEVVIEFSTRKNFGRIGRAFATKNTARGGLLDYLPLEPSP